jgi:hypothetical protein
MLVHIENKKLSESLDLFNNAVGFLTHIEKDNGIIINENASMTERVAAFNDLATIKQQCDYLCANSTKAHTFYVAFSTKLNAYLDSEGMYVHNPGSTHGVDQIPLQFNGHNATLRDVINVINNHVTDACFSVSSHFDYDTESVHGANWLDADQVKYSINHQWIIWHDDDQHSGISWKVDKCDGCNRDWDFQAKGSAQAWESYEVAKPTDGGTAYNDLVNFLSQNG